MKNMFTRLRKYLVTSVFLFCLLLTNVVPSSAQTAKIDSAITFLQLGQVESYIMRGPFSDDRIVFGLPADWQLVEGGTLQLFLGVSFSNGVTGDALDPTSQAIQNGGTLSVMFNNAIVGVIQLEEVGEQSLTIDIPLDALTSRRSDKFMDLRLILDSSDSCDINQNTMVVVHGSSNITLSHNTVLPDINLANFPYTIYRDTFVSDTAVIVTPDKPTSAELQSALSVVAGLGNLTSSKFDMTMTTESLLSPEQISSNHIIFVGKVGSLPILSQLKPSVSVANGKFNLPENDPDDGVVQMVNSPWSAAHVVLIVSGSSDVGVVKAAQAVTTGILRPSYGTNLSVVKDVNEIPVPISIPVDSTLADLGYEESSLQSRGAQTFSYTFFVPPGKTVTTEAFFELAYGHSNLLNYQRTGVVVRLNGMPIGSIRMSDETAANPINLTKIGLPSAVIRPGVNRLDLRANLEPKDICAPQDLRGEWITVWPQSRLHLPLSDAQATTSSDKAVSLTDYPAPFVNDPTMGTTAFILEKDNLTSWQSALGIARYLGVNTGGVMTTLKVFYADEVTPEQLAQYNLVFVGYPSKIKILRDINHLLPAPFDTGDVATEKNVQVIFRIPADSPIGYIEILRSPWNANNVILAVLGNTSDGLVWAAAPLGDSPLRSRLAGNFASINDQQIITADTRLSPTEAGVNTLPVPGLNGGTAASPDANPVNGWIPFVLVIAVSLLIITLAGVLYFGRLRNRTRTKVKDPTGTDHSAMK